MRRNLAHCVALPAFIGLSATAEAQLVEGVLQKYFEALEVGALAHHNGTYRPLKIVLQSCGTGRSQPLAAV